MKIPSYFFSLVAIGLFACCSSPKAPESETTTDALADSVVADSVENVIEETPMPQAADALFDDFIFNFAANRKLQRSRIVFPLKYNNNGALTTISKSKWKMDYLFMTDEFYTLLLDNANQREVVSDTTIHRVVIEKIQLREQQIRNYVFERRKGIWLLTELQDMPIEDTADADFLNFYKQWSNDTIFQNQHIANDVTFSAPDPDDELNDMTGTMMPEQWPDFKPEMIPGGTIFNIDYGNTSHSEKHKTLIIRGIANGMETSLTFKRDNGKWKLTKFTY